MIKYFRNDPFEKKNIIMTKSFSSNWSLITLFLNKTNKNENTGCHDMFIPCKSHLTSKQQSFIFLLFGSWSLVRSSHPEVFCKKGVLRNFAKFTGKHLCQRPFFNKVVALRPATLLKRDPGTGISMSIFRNF